MSVENVIDNNKEENATPRFFLRFVAGVIDLGLTILLYFAFYYTCMATPIGNTYNNYYNRTQFVQHQVSDTTNYYKMVYLDDEQTKALYPKEQYTWYTDPNNQSQYVMVEYDKNNKAAYENALSKNTEYNNLFFDLRLINYGIIAGCLAVDEIILLFLIPLFNKKGATLGQLASGLMVIDHKYATKPKWYQFLGRYFFMLIIDTLFPFLFVGMWTIVIAPAVITVLSLFSKEKRTVHDLITRTKVIDKETHVPLIEEEVKKHSKIDDDEIIDEDK